MKDIIVLGIESSCDETAVAIVKNRKEILSSVVATQIDVQGVRNLAASFRKWPAASMWKTSPW